jgi:hypothetical protein
MVVLDGGRAAQVSASPRGTGVLDRDPAFETVLGVLGIGGPDTPTP